MKKYSRLIALTLLSLLTVFAFLKLGNIDISWNILTRLNWGWLGLVFVTFYTSHIVRGTRWQRILNTMGWPVKYLYAQTLLISGLFVSAILPARLGDVGRIVMLRQDHKVPVAQGLASIATERALDVFSILTLAAIGAIWAVQGRVPDEVRQLMMGATLLFIIGLGALLTIPSIEQWLRNLIWLKKSLPESLWGFYQKVLDFGFSLIHGVRALVKNPLTLTLTIIESLFIWLCDSLMIYFVLISIGVPTPLSVTLFAGMVSDLAAAVPLTPGALGQFDAALVGMLTLFGLSLADASLAILLVRFVGFWTFVPVSGLITYAFGFSKILNLNRTEITIAPQTPSPLSASSPAEG